MTAFGLPFRYFERCLPEGSSPKTGPWKSDMVCTQSTARMAYSLLQDRKWDATNLLLCSKPHSSERERAGTADIQGIRQLGTVRFTYFRPTCHEAHWMASSL
jgi:hypothetical protein